MMWSYISVTTELNLRASGAYISKFTIKRAISMVMMILIIITSIPAFAGETQLLQVSGFDANTLYKEGSDVLIIRTQNLKAAVEKYIYQVFGAIEPSELERLVQETMNYFSPNTGYELQSNNDEKMITSMYKQDNGDYIVYTRASEGFKAPNSNNGNSYLDFLKSHPEVETIEVMGMIIYDKRQPDEQNRQGLNLIEPALADPTFSPDGKVIFNNKPAQSYPINKDFFNPEKSPLGKTETSKPTTKPITPIVQTPVSKPEVIKPVVVEPVDKVVDNTPILKPSQDIQISIKPDDEITITKQVVDALKDNDSDVIIKTETGKTKEVDTNIIDKEVVIISTPKSDNLYPEEEYIDLSNKTDNNESTVNINDDVVIVVITDSKDEVIINTPDVIITVPSDSIKDEAVLIKVEDKRSNQDLIDPITIITIDNDRKINEVTFKDSEDKEVIVVGTEDGQSIYVPSSKNNPENLIKTEVESGDTISLWTKEDGSHIKDPIIKALFERRIIKGYPDGTFGENQTITRAEASSMIYNALSNTNRVKKNVSTFIDVNKDSWFFKYVYGNDAFKGYPDGKFRPQNNITKEEMYSLVARLTNLKDNGNLNSFESSEWSKSYINKILNLEFIDKVSNVKSSITRGEVFNLIYKIVIEDLEK